MLYYATKRSAKLSCRHIDPSGKHAVGVVTKADLAEPGIKDRLEATGADHLRLELGYVAVWDLNLPCPALPCPALPCPALPCKCPCLLHIAGA